METAAYGKKAKGEIGEHRAVETSKPVSSTKVVEKFGHTHIVRNLQTPIHWLVQPFHSRVQKVPSPNLLREMYKLGSENL